MSFLILTPVCLLISEFLGSTVRAQMENEIEIPQEKELFNTLPGGSQEGNILDATNPLDLMNQLRRATALDNATTPSDAIDEALKALELEGM